MRFGACPQQEEVSQLLTRGYWPHAAPPELADHIRTCRDCRQLVSLTERFQAARALAAREAGPGSAGAIWWRAQLRRRYAAFQQVGKPILGAQIFALAVFLSVAVGLAVWQAKNLLHWALPSAISSGWSATLTASGWNLAVLVSTLAALLLFSAAAVYLSIDKK